MERWQVELSPVAKEKLARIGEPTAEEKARLKHCEELASLLAKYFTNELSLDGLWKELRRHKDEGRESLLKDAQIRILEAMKLSSNDMDMDKLRQGLLAAETLKEGGDYAGVENELKSIDELRRRYKEERVKEYGRIKDNVERQVKLAAQRLAGQTSARGAAIDVQSSVEATTKSSAEWKNFISKHESTYNRKFEEHLNRLRQRL